MLRNILLCVVVFTLCGCAGQGYAVNQTPDVIPAVRQWDGGEGFIDISKAPIVIESNYMKQLNKIADIFAVEAGAELSGNVKKGIGKKLHITNNSKPVAGSIFLSLYRSVPQGASSEMYTIEITDKVVIRGVTPVGVYWGTRTLLQLLAQSDGKLPKGTIQDWPDYPIRSVLLDAGRKFIPFEELKDWIVALSYFKMNELHLHLNDNCWEEYGAFRVEMKTIPELTSKDGHYTQKQIRELQDFAKARGVTITPEFDSPGHSRAFTTVRPDLAHPKLGANYLDITNPGTYKFMEKVFDEIIPLFDAPHIHIGTDEYRLNRIADKAEREVLGEKFRQYINYFNDYIRAKGKTVRIWSGYEHMPGTTEPDKSVVIDMWETSDAKNKSKAGYKFINSTHLWTYIVPGAPYYGVSDTFLYNDWTALKFSNKPNGQLTKDDPGLLGGKLHIWNDFGTMGYTTNEIARLSIPTVLVMAEKLWGVKGSDDYNSFGQRAERILGTGNDFEMAGGSHSSHSSGNPQLAQIPSTTFMQRQAQSNNGIVWQLNDTPKHIVPNTRVALEIAGDAKNLEYPWTATFTLTRLTDTPNTWEIKGSGGEILISSELATFYLDYLHISKDGKTKEVTEKRGVACVRANHTKARNPINTKTADIVMFGYQVPRHKKVTLTFVGHMKRTELYVDGKLVGSSNKQMVCPLERLGDTYPNGFHGILHEAKIYDRAPSEAIIGKWKPADMSQEWKQLDWPMTKLVTSPGSYSITFQYTSGGHRLDIQWAALLEDGKEIARDTHEGRTGGSSQQNTYTFDINNIKSNAK
ncbi:MAG: family 20 glycosylhydrolase, partial [Anaerohalosphaera sp.]|nr:family 20 glycosylhydrolase [Anaerohalosphaera sp.]